MVQIIGSPFDYCGYRSGSRLGPAALRLANLSQALADLEIDVSDSGDISVSPEFTAPGGLRNFEPALEAYLALKSEVIGAVGRGRIPLVLGGDHSGAIGTVSGALDRFGDDLAVLWIDAHVDLNTPDTSPSGNLHGMVLGALMDLPWKPDEVDSLRYSEEQVETEWKRLIRDFSSNHPLRPERTGWFAVRDVDPGEKKRLHAIQPGYMSTMFDIDRYGVVEMILKMDGWLRETGARKLWISFDVDSLDPFLAPGTGTAVRGGLSYREMHMIGEMLFELMSAADCPYSLAGVDLVEVNPLFDTNNETARTTVEWIASLFGKSILGKR